MKPHEMTGIKDLDCIMRDNDWVLYRDGKPLLTPAGNEVAHTEGRILKHILIKLTITGSIGIEVLNSYVVFAYQKDHLENGSDPLLENLDAVIDQDILIKLKTGTYKQEGLQNVDGALEYLEKNSILLNLIYTGVSEIGTRINNFLFSGDTGNNPDASSIKLITDFIRQNYTMMTNEQKSAVSILSLYHNGGILLPLMFVRGYIASSEYANVLMALHLKYMQKKRHSTARIIGAGYHGYDDVFHLESPQEGFLRIHEESLRVKEYLSFFYEINDRGKGMLELIREGEENKVEFKTSLRWDVYQNKKNPAIEHASLKSVAAFLNSDGGDLLIGVEDDGNIAGIEIDRFANDDKFLLHFWNLIKASIGQEVTPYISTFLEKFDGKTVCRVSCKPAPFPVFLHHKGFNEDFYIRTGPGSTSLEIREALNYISERFKNDH